MNCTGKRTRRSAPRPLIQQAVEFLRGDELVLEPRVRWPGPALQAIHASFPEAVQMTEKGRFKSTIPEPLRLQPGRTLCIWGDAGWGPDVGRGKYETGSFSDELVGAAARLLRERWKPEPAPGWVTAVPSTRRPALMHGFAQRLAEQLGIPFVDVLRKVRETAPQKEMQNSVQQLRNLLNAFSIEGRVPPGAVLLVDDVIDSGWTLCLLGAMLQRHGSGPVFPFTLAKASPRGS
jgi:ATP-dependent DNA helicase RecQ